MTARRTRTGPLRRRWQGYVGNACKATFKTASAYRQHHCR